jgi:UDP-GlcNAc:undecaprenyl-phosphate/decaprenyl-phosphate GlcNAc-1-phosphate transferase
VNPLVVLVAALIAFATSMFTTPYVRRLALNVGMLDATGERRMHDQPKPRIGGIAVYLGFAVALFSALGYLIQTQQFGQPGRIAGLENVHDMIGLIFGGTLILMVGIWDDVMGMSPRTKLFAQIVVAGISMLYGFVVPAFFTNPLHHGQTVFLPHGFEWLVYPLTLFWYVAMMNAINFIDGLDGLLSGVTVISATSLIVIDLTRGHAEIALVLAALAGSALGFLRYNWNPAKIILGDSGALFIGYVFATVSIIGVSKTAFAISLLVPLLVLALPVVDTAVAIVRRTRAGKKFYEADRGHFHHQLVFRFGLNVRQAVLLIYAVCLVLGVVAYLLTTGIVPLKLA